MNEHFAVGTFSCTVFGSQCYQLSRCWTQIKREAIEVLQNALQLRTDPKSKFGLHWHILGVLDERLQKSKNGMTKEAINMAIFNHILGHSTKSCLVLSKGHSKVKVHLAPQFFFR